MSKMCFNRIVILLFASSLLLSIGVSNAMAAELNSSHSSLNVRAGLDEWIDKLDPRFQTPMNWIVDNTFVIVVVCVLLLLWYHSLKEAGARKGGSISSQAQHESASEAIVKRFGMSLVYSVLILLLAGTYLMKV